MALAYTRVIILSSWMSKIMGISHSHYSASKIPWISSFLTVNEGLTYTGDQLIYKYIENII